MTVRCQSLFANLTSTQASALTTRWNGLEGMAMMDFRQYS
jgi:hypothetical protein